MQSTKKYCMKYRVQICTVTYMQSTKVSKLRALLAIHTNLDLGLSMNNKSGGWMVTLTYLLAVSSNRSMAGRPSFFQKY